MNHDKAPGKGICPSRQAAEERTRQARQWLLSEMESERKWDEAFSRSSGQLARLGEEALKEHGKGRTRVLDPDQL